MKRAVKLIEYAVACDETKALYDEAMRTLGTDTVPNWMKAQGGNPRVLRSNWEKFKYTVLTGEIPPLLKQLILYVIAVRGDNQYCTSAHGYAALSLDTTLTCEDLDCLCRGESYKGLPESYKVAIDVITQLALERSIPEQREDFVTRLHGAGFSDGEIDELLAQADFGIMWNVIIDINDVPPERPFPPPKQAA